MTLKGCCLPSAVRVEWTVCHKLRSFLYALLFANQRKLPKYFLEVVSCLTGHILLAACLLSRVLGLMETNESEEWAAAGFGKVALSPHVFPNKHCVTTMCHWEPAEHTQTAVSFPGDHMESESAFCLCYLRSHTLAPDKRQRRLKTGQWNPLKITDGASCVASLCVAGKRMSINLSARVYFTVRSNRLVVVVFQGVCWVRAERLRRGCGPPSARSPPSCGLRRERCENTWGPTYKNERVS